MMAGPAWRDAADVVVIGTGVAGLAAALAADRAGRSVVVLSKAAQTHVTATHYAQGGIAVVLPDNDDSVDAHVADTLAAGAGLCDPDAVYSIVADGYRAVTDLVGAGARLDESVPGRWALTREGGHSRRRIVHAGGDATGAEVQRALQDAAGMLDIRTGHVALRVLHDGTAVTGLLVVRPDGCGIISAPSVILATGGLGHLYSATTNPAGSTGDGIALGLWAGVAVSDLEFIQFHPTMLFAGRAGGRRPLITEAIRGEGAILVDRQGNSITAGVHPMGDLAPRDVVAAAIDARLKATGDPCVYLDARGIEGFASRFPTVTASCRAAGIDPVRQPIPVVPGAHYSCGGIVTDVYGQTELLGLYAAGEVARTGLHGANRLASNSLLEGLVVGGRAGKAAAAHAAAAGRSRATSSATWPEPISYTALDRGDLQRAMSRDASMYRAAAGLHRLWRQPIRSTGSRRGLSPRFRGRGAHAGRAERDRRRLGPHRKPWLPSSRGVPVHRAGAGTQHRGPGSRRRKCGVCPGASGGVLMGLSDWELAAARAAIARGLDEDLRYGPDVTTLATVPASATTTASLVTREAGVVAGLDVALLTLNEVLGTNGYRVLDRVEDGARVPPGEALMTLEAQTRGLLTAERTMLNLVGHLSGIATATAAWVDAVRGTKAKIRDTRKTLPGLRALQKYAVRTGGGVNHRLGLGDAALIKDNHVAAAGSVVDALRAVRNAAPDLPCEVEVDSLEQLDAVLPEKPELILLDNFAVWQTQTAVQRRDSRAPTVMLESSGGLSLQTAATYAETGVDYLAVGALTHSVRVLDIGLDM